MTPDLRTRVEQCKRLVRALSEFAALHGITTHPDAMDVPAFLDEMLTALAAAEQREQALRETVDMAHEQLATLDDDLAERITEAERRAFEAGVGVILMNDGWRFDTTDYEPEQIDAAFRAYQQSRQP